MKPSLLALVALFVFGCSAKVDPPSTGPREGEKKPPATERMPKSESSAPKEVEKFGDDVFKVPPYPGAEIVQYSSIEMSDDIVHSYNRHYKTMDSVDKVAEHFMAEGAKAGKLADTSMTNKPGGLMRVVIVEFGSGEKLQVQAMNIPKDNSTDISVHLMQSKKK
ncbi:MAG: hypothetical protein WCG75_12440 [Armatimonadota bacterium]